MDAKRELIFAKLEKRRHQNDSNSHPRSNSASGNSVDFTKIFYAERDAILDDMNKIVDKSRADDTDEITTRISALQRLLNEKTAALSAYEARKAMDALRDLQNRLKNCRDQPLKSKPRFAFSNRSKTAPMSKEVKEGGDQADRAIPIFMAPKNAVVIENRGQENVIIDDDCRGKDVLILDCDSSSITLNDGAGTVHVKFTKSCTIIIKKMVSSSIFVDRCTECIFVFYCGQLRVHSSIDCDFYVRVSGGAIIEDCQRVRFAPCDFDTDNDEENLWDRVQDFNWLVADQPSPNWTIIPVEERRRFPIKM